MKRKALILISLTLLASCASSIQKQGANIKLLYFDNVPSSPIKIGEFDKAGITLHVEYSDKSKADYPVKENWLPETYLHYLGEEGSYAVDIYFRGKTSTLSFAMTSNPTAPQYQVKFLDFAGNLLEEYRISHRKDAICHVEVPIREGYRFANWDASIYGVCEDTTYHPVYLPA